MKIKKLLSILLAAVLAVMSMSATVSAVDPYTTYNYDAWSNAIPSQAGYEVVATYDSVTMHLEQLSDPNSEFFISEDEPATMSDMKDFFLSPNNEFYIVDTGNNRIIKTDLEFNLLACYKNFPGSYTKHTIIDEEGNETVVDADELRAPYGIFVDEDDVMYIADRDNQRIVKCVEETKTSARILSEYYRPETELYDSVSFYCTKVLVDAAKNVYVICPAVNKGAIMFSDSGSFVGYYGANRVEVTAEVIRNKIWRKIASEEQLASLVKTTPVEYANFDIDDEGFIWTVTEVANASTDAVKKMNPAGYNILERTADNNKFGDQISVTYNGTTYATRLTDISVSEEHFVNILDYTSGRIFQYDERCNQLLIFGFDQEEQRGGFYNPNAIESHGDNIYVLDGRNCDITVFGLTEFGRYVHEAIALHNKGLYEEAYEIWQEVLKRDGGFYMALLGTAKALYNQNDYEGAMKYAKLAFTDTDYDKAFEANRQESLRKNFTLYVVIILLVAAAWITINILKKKKKIPQKLIATGVSIVAAKGKTLIQNIVENAKKGGKGK